MNDTNEKMKRAFAFFSEHGEYMWHLFLQTNDALTITDEDESIVMVNPSYEMMTGYTFDDALGKRPSMLKSHLTPRTTYQEMKRALKEKGSWTGELINSKKDGTIFYAEQTITKITHENETYFISIMRDVTDKVERQKEIHQLAYYDQLTGLPNHVYAKELIADQIASNDWPFAFMLFNIDRFKYINDGYGHDAGDRAILEMAKRLSRLFTDQGLVGRFSGDTFIVFIQKEMTEGDLMNELHHQLLKIRHQPFNIEGDTLYLTLSGGVRFSTGTEDMIEQLIKHAEQAMYQAKREGRNTVRLFKQSNSRELLNRLGLVHELNQALEHEEFIVYYQPQYSFKRQKVTGVEALVRWDHKDRGILTPYHFLSEAEEFGLLSQIDQQVMKQAFNQTKIWHDEGYTDLEVSVNMSYHLFNQVNVVDIVDQLIHDSGLAPTSICIEITESIALNQVTHASDTIKAFQALGVKVALDDFGTGYSSLSQLRNFTFDRIKVDQAFIRESTGEDMDAKFVEAIIHMAKLFGFDVVIEGIETFNQLVFVRNNYADKAQGYLIQKPVPTEQVQLALKFDDISKDE
jgi:diguanylate cyclase (GGDEF)-like protein/PAS domain S-box-containing protein